MDRGVRLIDNAVPLVVRDWTYNMARNSSYRIGWNDTSLPEHAAHANLHCPISGADIVNTEIYKHVHQAALEEVQGLDLVRAVINLSTPFNSNFIHTHEEKKVVLYYCNLEWFDGWHGETLFYNDDKNSILFATPYIPGRIVVFDGSIPHTIRPQSASATNYRFTLALLYN